ncbi:hypothetical protein AAG596_11815 [Citromicrobium bathyomarinum]|uniref:hypothetical protein n=1 Tax=Citromicrobium TaxID=72173 RepID=UPI000313000E|nr:hypothetical protein [Citromicrobium sp. JLT1363]
MQTQISQSTWLRIGAGAAAVLLVLGWAWWDGGEQPLRPMAHAIDLPEVAE